MTVRSSRRTLRSAVLTIVLALLAAACSDVEAVDDAPVFALDREATSGIQPIDPDREDVLPASMVRTVLQDLLTEHSDLSIEVMRQAVDGDVSAESLEQLTRNTDELAVTVGLVYGRDGAAAFDQLWTNHIEFFNDYAAAQGADDSDAAEEAIVSLGHYESDFSSYIDTATSGEADFHAVLHVLHSHVSQLLEQADAWSSGDYVGAVALSIDAHRHMDVIANALAIGIGRQQPTVFTGDPTAPDAVRCATLLLDGSSLLALMGSLAIAERSGSANVASVTRAALAEARSEADDTAKLAVDQLLMLEPDAMASAAGRANARDTVRERLAADNCDGHIVGGS